MTEYLSQLFQLFIFVFFQLKFRILLLDLCYLVFQSIIFFYDLMVFKDAPESVLDL